MGYIMVVGDSQNLIAPHTIIREMCPDHTEEQWFSDHFWTIKGSSVEQEAGGWLCSYFWVKQPSILKFLMWLLSSGYWITPKNNKTLHIMDKLKRIGRFSHWVKSMRIFLQVITWLSFFSLQAEIKVKWLSGLELI